jgi:hypothetical protein
MKTKKVNYNIHPLLRNLPEYLKNPANYISIRKQILETLAVGHSHSELEGYAKCPTCTQKMLDRRRLLKKLGFKNPAQYLVWQKVHEEIARSYPLVDWSALNTQRMLDELKQK